MSGCSFGVHATEPADGLGSSAQERSFLRLLTDKVAPGDLERVDFAEVEERCGAIARELSAKFDEVCAIYRMYANAATIEDEISRSLYLLENIRENAEYFQARVRKVSSIMPRNQLLYSLVYMGVIPAMAARTMCARPPGAGACIVKRLFELLSLDKFCPGLELSQASHYQFTLQHCRDSELVIFTGRSSTAARVRRAIGNGPVFLLNGAGHNPIVVAPDADIERAALSVARVVFYNAGQDCSAPNSILVHASVAEKLTGYLQALAEDAIAGRPPPGLHADPIAPNTDSAHVKDTAAWLVDMAPHVRFGGRIDLAERMIFPTIVNKPLRSGPHYRELFAPIVMLQPYDDDSELISYFVTKTYRRRAMYVTVFGVSELVDSMAGSSLHPESTVLREMDLHEHERGTQPYGGMGPEASSVWFGGSHLPTPILPQREIHRFVVVPRLRAKNPAVRTEPVRSERLQVNIRGRLGSRRAHRSVHDLHDAHRELEAGATTSDRATVRGRVSAARNGGTFVDVNDATGKIQIYRSTEAANGGAQGVAARVRRGQFVEVTGVVRRTHRGELTLDSEEFFILSAPSVPEGSSDWELAAAPDVRGVAALGRVIRSLREGLWAQGYVEAESFFLPCSPAKQAEGEPQSTDRGAMDSWVLGLLNRPAVERVFYFARANQLVRAWQDDARAADLFLTSIEAYVAPEEFLTRVQGLVAAIAGVDASRDGAEDGRLGSRLSEMRHLDALALISDRPDVGDPRTDRDVRALAERSGIHVEPDASWSEVVEQLVRTRVAALSSGFVAVVGPPRTADPLEQAHPEDLRRANGFRVFWKGLEVAWCTALEWDATAAEAFRAPQLYRLNGSGLTSIVDYSDCLDCVRHGIPPAVRLTLNVDQTLRMLQAT